MPKFRREFADETGWSRVINPKMGADGLYRLGCCDCGLVHDVEFVVVRVVERRPDGSYDFEDVEDQDYKVHFRVRRNNRSTAQIRRKPQRFREAI